MWVQQSPVFKQKKLAELRASRQMLLQLEQLQPVSKHAGQLTAARNKTKHKVQATHTHARGSKGTGHNNPSQAGVCKNYDYVYSYMPWHTDPGCLSGRGLTTNNNNNSGPMLPPCPEEPMLPTCTPTGAANDHLLLGPDQIDMLLALAVSNCTGSDMVGCCKVALQASHVGNIIRNYLVAVKYNLCDVMDKMLHIIRRNFLCISRSQEFLSLPLEYILLFMEDSYLNVHNELDMFVTALMWIDYNKQERITHSGRVLKCIRYAYIDPGDIVCYVEPNLHLFTGHDGAEALVNLYKHHVFAHTAQALPGYSSTIPPRRGMTSLPARALIVSGPPNMATYRIGLQTPPVKHKVTFASDTVFSPADTPPSLQTPASTPPEGQTPLATPTGTPPIGEIPPTTTTSTPAVPGAQVASTTAVPGAQVASTTGAQVASTLDVPGAQVVSTPSTQVASTTAVPGAQLASTTGAQVASTLDVPGAQVASTTAVQGAQVASTTAVPGAHVASTTAVPDAQVASTTPVPGAQVASTTVVPGAQVASSTTVPGVQVSTNTTVPGAQVASTLDVPSAQVTSTLGAHIASTPSVPGAQVDSTPVVPGARVDTTPAVPSAQVATVTSTPAVPSAQVATVTSTPASTLSPQDNVKDRSNNCGNPYGGWVCTDPSMSAWQTVSHHLMSSHGPQTVSNHLMSSHGPQTVSHHLMSSHGPQTVSHHLMSSHGPQTVSHHLMSSHGPQTDSHHLMSSHGPQTVSNHLMSSRVPQTDSHHLMSSRVPQTDSHHLMSSRGPQTDSHHLMSSRGPAINASYNYTCPRHVYSMVTSASQDQLRFAAVTGSECGRPARSLPPFHGMDSGSGRPGRSLPPFHGMDSGSGRPGRSLPPFHGTDSGSGRQGRSLPPVGVTVSGCGRLDRTVFPCHVREPTTTELAGKSCRKSTSVQTDGSRKTRSQEHIIKQSQPLAARPDTQSQPLAARSDTQSQPLTARSDTQRQPLTARPDTQSHVYVISRGVSGPVLTIAYPRIETAEHLIKGCQ